MPWSENDWKSNGWSSESWGASGWETAGDAPQTWDEWTDGYWEGQDGTKWEDEKL